MLGSDKEGQIYHYNKDKFLTPWKTMWFHYRGQLIKPAGLKCNQILKGSQAKHVSPEVTQS